MEIKGSGTYFEVSAKEPVFDNKHLWVVGVAYTCNPENIKSLDDAILDHENFLTAAGPACFFCGFYYREEIKDSPCEGDPEEIRGKEGTSG